MTVDLKALRSKKVKPSMWSRWTTSHGTTSPSSSPTLDPHNSENDDETDSEDDLLSDEETVTTKTWENLTRLKERVKQLHGKIWWIRLFDIIATNTSLVVVDVGELQISSFTVAVDVRKKTIDRGRLFLHRKSPEEEYRRPAEWILTARSILFSTDGGEFNEILDYATLNIHGMLSRKKEGLRDASIALKLGRLRLPVDDLQTCKERIQMCRRQTGHSRHSSRASHADASLLDLLEAPDQPGSPTDQFAKAVADSRHFVSSILKGIHEVQFAVGYVGLSKRVESLKSKGAPVYINVSMKEVGIDLLRLDARSPAHLMYFSRSDIAHQALLTAISISVGIDDGHDHPERLLYIPLGTATVKTTLPSKALQLAKDKDLASRNSNILFANIVVTSPSIDLDPKHLPLTLALLETWRERTSTPPTNRHNSQRLIAKLLPKSNIKFSIHEPVIRVSLPCMEVERRGTGDYDLIISAMSSMTLDLESSHSPSGELHYAVAGGYRIMSHQLYYQTAAGEKFNLLLTDSFEVKVAVNASPNVAVTANINAQTFNLYMVRPEISEGVRQIVVQLYRDVHQRRQTSEQEALKKSMLRKLPPWLCSVRWEGTDFNLEVAGVDAGVSDQAKGISVHLENWTADYKVDKSDGDRPRQTRRRTTSRSLQSEDMFLRAGPKVPAPSLLSNNTNGRRLAIHTYGLEAFVIEAADTWESEPFMSLPRFEIAITTSTDAQGPVQHINSFSKYAYFHYSLYRHYAIGVATSVLRKTFARPRSEQPVTAQHVRSRSEDLRPVSPGTMSRTEVTTIDFKASLIQIKGNMPANPNIMLQVYSVEAGHHRWTSPFLKANLIRLYAEAPKLKKTWSRILSARSLNVNYRSTRKKQGLLISEERSIEIATEAVRVAVPHQLVMHKIFDNITNIVKTAEQLHHRFRTGSTEYVLKKEPQQPKQVPKISFRSHALLFELEDSSFEWKLGLIYVQGLHEQRQRIAREEAFQLKKKKLLEMDASMANRRETNESKERRGWHLRGRNKEKDHSAEDLQAAESRSKSAGEAHDTGNASKPTSRRLRYDTEGTSHLSEHAQRSIKDAMIALHKFNAQSWKLRINKAYKRQQDRMKEIHSTIWGLDIIPDGIEQKEKVVGIPQRPALFGALMHDFVITIDKPSFALHDYATFLHRMGKGMPRDMKYSLLIPMHVHITMRDARASLRDYPLPLIHIPRPKADQSGRVHALSLSTDFVIAEEFRDEESIRYAKVVVVPADRNMNGMQSKGWTVQVRRTVGSVKTYSDMSVEINTAMPTRITWGASYQPAIQDMMQVIEGFMKPAVDPSQRVGFWDKIRLAFHSRINIAWKSQGDVHLILKGSRDPYLVTGVGAGFVMCWRKDVRWSICQSQDPKKFMTVNSGEYVLAIPDFAHFARRSLDGANVENSNHTNSTVSDKTGKFKKTVMKLSGNVLWMAGIVFERNTQNGRSFDFRHHYDVVLKNPKFAKPSAPGEDYDAFRGFRSNHIHLSIAIAAPVDRDWSVTNLRPSSNYNSVHLTPRFFSHFFSWWSMFSGTMSLPIKQGKLWPGVDKMSKKFGRHLATIKYNLLLSPLYLAHIYKYKGPDDHGKSAIFATGLKLKLDSFMLDLHQRRETFRKFMPGDRQVQTSGVRINKAQLDFISADFRAVSAIMKEPSAKDVDETSDAQLAKLSDHLPKANLANFVIPDRNTGWVDMDDFVELDWILPMETTPQTQILPLVFTPRFTYFRQTDHHNIINGDPNRSSDFGNEDTHYCVMSARNDPRRVQCDLIRGRLDKIAEQIARHKLSIGDFELKVVREAEAPEKVRKDLEQMQTNHDILLRKQAFLQDMHSNLLRRLEDNELMTPAGQFEHDEFYEAREEYEANDTEGLENIPLTEDISDFNNRFVIHNAQLKWSNSLRDIVLRYIHQVSQRRGFVYYMSRPAVKFILDIVEEQHKLRRTTSAQSDQHPTEPATPSSFRPGDDKEREEATEGMIKQILEDGKRFVEAQDDPQEDTPSSPGSEPGNEISHDFTAQNAYHVRLIAPQIQLQSDKNTKSAVLITSKGMQLKVVQIMDKDRVTDEVSGLVQRRFSANMDSVQVFVTSSKTFSEDLLQLYSANRYGAPAGSSWPPWVPLEDMFDFHVDPYGFSRVVQRTSASMQYNKYNTLRLKYNDDVRTSSGPTDDTEHDSRIDHITVDFPQLLTKCNSTQYFALYVIVLDLLLYSEPQEKTREEKLEKIMLASDFTDLSDVPTMVTKLQSKIRTLQEIKLMFQLHESTLGRHQWKERIILEDDLARREDELFFIMKAITTSQSQARERVLDEHATGKLKWEIMAKELVWHMVYINRKTKAEESLIELQLKKAQFLRIDNTNGSNDNTIEIGNVEGWTLLKDANYPQLIAPFVDDNTRAAPSDPSSISHPMARVHWFMLEAIAGIIVMERFEVAIVPLKVSLDYETGHKLMEYLFPKMKDRDRQGNSQLSIKNMLPTHAEDIEADSSPVTNDSPSQSSTLLTVPNDHLTGAGDLELRLQPTLNLPGSNRTPKSPRKDKKASGSQSDLLRLRHLGGQDGSGEIRVTPWRRKNGSSENLTPASRSILSRTGSHQSEASKQNEAPKRFGLLRANSSAATAVLGKKGNSNDVTEMMDRASRYMTLTYVNVASMVLCLSYKGKGQRNLVTDVHDLVFRMPMLEYRNKTWSNLDLFNHLRREVGRALFSHSGAILGNMLSVHRAAKQQQSRLREIAHSSILLGGGLNSEASSTIAHTSKHKIGDTGSSYAMDDDASGYESPIQARSSFASGRGSAYSREEPITTVTSDSSSIASSDGPAQQATSTSANGRSARKSRNGNPALNTAVDATSSTRPKTSSSTTSRLSGHFPVRRPGSARSSESAYATPPASNSPAMTAEKSHKDINHGISFRRLARRRGRSHDSTERTPIPEDIVESIEVDENTEGDKKDR